MRWTIVFILGSSFGCATDSRVCRIMEQKSEWHRLSSIPEFVSELTYEQMYPRGTSPEPDEVAWYSTESGRIAACRLGNRYGCGESLSYFTDGELEGEPGEIVVCGEEPAS